MRRSGSRTTCSRCRSWHGKVMSWLASKKSKSLRFPWGSTSMRLLHGVNRALRAPCVSSTWGTMDERKGVDVLAAAASELDQRGCKFELTTIGNGSSTISFADIGRSKHLGWLPRVRLAAELATHDVLVLPSRHDSFGIVVAEAMACGLPVIVTENVGAKEMVTPGDDGQIVPVGDAAALASAMSWFMDHAATLPEMSAAARSKAESYSWAAYQSKVVSQIRKICGVQSAPALAASS